MFLNKKKLILIPIRYTIRVHLSISELHLANDYFQNFEIAFFFNYLQRWSIDDYNYAKNGNTN